MTTVQMAIKLKVSLNSEVSCGSCGRIDVSSDEAGRRGDGVWRVVPDTGCGGTERPVADRQVVNIKLIMTHRVYSR